MGRTVILGDAEVRPVMLVVVERRFVVNQFANFTRIISVAEIGQQVFDIHKCRVAQICPLGVGVLKGLQDAVEGQCGQFQVTKPADYIEDKGQERPRRRGRCRKEGRLRQQVSFDGWSPNGPKSKGLLSERFFFGKLPTLTHS